MTRASAAPAPPAAPRLGPRRRTDPSWTLAKLKDVVSPHCGIVLGMERLQMRDPQLRGIYGYWANVEHATMLGNTYLQSRRLVEPEKWRKEAEGRNGSRVAYDRTRAFVRAVGEALERYACCTYDPTPFVTAPWRDVKDIAIDPRAMQRPDAREYAAMKAFRPFEADSPMRWQWAWSLRDEAHRLLPAQDCYLMYNTIPGEPMLSSTTSTGWALHHTYEEAIHTGLREVIERDSFFVHWLNRMPMPRLDLDDITDPAAARFRDTMRESGIDLQVRVTTTDLGVPSFATFLVDERPGKAAFLMTTAAHPDPVRGLRQTLEEAAMMHVYTTGQAREGFADTPRMEDIETMGHHHDFYLNQENLGPLRWMFEDDAPRVRLADLPRGPTSGDIWEEVRFMVDRIGAAGYDTLFADTTPPDLREAEWCAAKVLVPGTVRHEYGYGMRYLDCARIYDAPVRMGRRAQPSRPEELNPDAHPYS